MTIGSAPSVLIGGEQLALLAAQGWFLLDGVLGPEEAGAARLDASSLRPRMSPAAIGRGHARRLDRNERGDLSLWLEGEALPAGLEPASAMFTRLQAEANEKVWLGLEAFELQLACYPGGGSAYERHLDVFRGGVAARRLTAIYYLNEAWSPELGGCLRLHLSSGSRDVEPIADRLLVFLSAEIEHEVLPALAERWALTAWYSGPRPLPGV